MNQNIQHIFWLFVAILLGGCTSAPMTGALPTQTIAPPTFTHTPQITAPAAAETTSTMTSPFINLPLADTVIFTIDNPQPWSGREGDPRPDWMGWGAETFAAAPDGSFWIADTAATPHRLLHYTAQGELLGVISLERIVVFSYDLAAAGNSLWLLDIASAQPRLVQLSLAGDVLFSMEIPAEVMTVEGMLVSNAAFSVLLGEEGAVWLNTLNGYYELVNTSGQVEAIPQESFTFHGHTYGVGPYDTSSGQLPIYVDRTALEMPADFYPEADAFLGVNPDGSFALAGYTQNTNGLNDQQVLYYQPSGELLGTARQLPQLFYKDWNHHLAFGPDGSVYQLVSYPDHSVQVIRLGFPTELPPAVSQPSPTVTPMAAIQPSTDAATDEEQARNTLVSFFLNLSAGNYAQAAALYGGEIDEYLRQPLPDETTEAFWEYLCTVLWCLPIAEISGVEQVSADEYLFYIVFIQPDGSRFQIGACCGGDPAASPPVWQFAYPVSRIDGNWQVQRLPLFTP